MVQKYSNDTKVFNWYFDMETLEPAYQELTVTHWEFLDGMQWEVINEYKLMKETSKVYFKFFTFVEQSTVRLPGHLISPDKLYAKILMLDLMIESYGYMLKNETVLLFTRNTYISVVKAEKELKILTEKYPELVLKALGEFRPDNSSASLVW